ncbi:hypothetical protein BN59_03024 [Legionella massiliensis]|uniref:Dot/Icm secretion system substrate n=1 Tax=Legionella massiliensis TaxID=1034943 RepID=A0A078L0C2_9GAMM|nr:hypothetical protein [Legionella massiliensis]CDZ78712.1 hypothetical protein BN59_03024 [Legionella massiliensis]CEE14450.1 hypothetical protein BN1094_03024 [Legionella massiliensis]
MDFVLSDEFIIKLKKIRASYEALAKINLSEASQPYAISIFFGAKDIKMRNRQISFIESMLAYLEKDLPQTPDDSFDSQRYLAALQILVCVSFYVKSQIDKTYTLPLRSSASATLGQLLDDAMGLTYTNPLDLETQTYCLLAAKRLIQTPGCYETINSCLKDSIPPKLWNDFTEFVYHESKPLNQNLLANFPATSIMIPIFAKPLELAGYATGFVLGDIVSKSTKLMPAQYALTTVVGSGLVLFVGSGGSLAAVFIAPTLASRLLDAYCGITLAWVMGNSMKLVGKGLGFGVGMTLDLSWKMLYSICSQIASLNNQKSLKLTGVSLHDGQRIIDGVPFKFIKLEECPPDHSLATVNINLAESSLSLQIDEKQTTIPLTVLDIEAQEEVDTSLLAEEEEQNRMAAYGA